MLKRGIERLESKGRGGEGAERANRGRVKEDKEGMKETDRKKGRVREGRY